MQIDTAAAIQHVAEEIISGSASGIRIPWTNIFIFLAGVGAAAGAIYLVTRKSYQQAIETLPSQQNLAVFGGALVASTAFVYFVTIFLKIKLDDNWESWLWFVTAMITGNIAYFTAKRKTAWKPGQTTSEVVTGEPSKPPSTGQFPAEQPAVIEPEMANDPNANMPGRI